MQRYRLAVAAAIAGLAFATGCGSDSGSGAAAGGAAPGVSKNEIVIGTSMGLTGPTAAEAQAALHGAQAYFNYVNDQGGVNGRKIKLIALDDGFKPSQTALNVRRLVTQNHVFSLFYTWGLNNTVGILPFVKQSKVPLVGPQAPTSQVTDPVQPNVFLMEPTFADEGAICAKTLMANDSVHKLGMLYENDAIGQDGLDGLKRATASPQKPVADPVAFTTGTPSFTGPITKLRKQGVDGLTIFGTNPDIVNIAKGIAASGWKPALCASSNVFDPTFLRLSGHQLDGLVGSLAQYLPASNEPGIVTYRERLHHYFPKAEATVFGVQAYGEAQLLVEALKSAGANPTWDSLEKALNGFSNVETGTIFPVSFSATNHDGLAQYRLVQIKNGAPAFVSGFKRFDAEE